MKPLVLQGCGTALVTPFTADGAVDYEAYARMVDRQVASGVDFLVPLATTGETPTLSAGEKTAIYQVVKEHAQDLMGSEQLALLERCMIEQTVVEGGKRRLRGKEDGFKGSGMLQSPYDPDATFRVKAGKSHHGYVANLELSKSFDNSKLTPCP